MLQNYKVALNICGGNGPYHNIPMFYEFESIREFTNFVRSEIISIILWSDVNYGIRSNLSLGVHIENEDLYWKFNIMVKNIREYNEYKKFNTEELENILKQKDREYILKEILTNDNL